MTQVIRRKLDRGRQKQAEGAPGADRGWRLALARTLRDMMGLDLEFQRLSVLRSSLAEVAELAPERALVALLDGPEGALGVLLMSPGVTATLIEMQTLGRIGAQTGPLRKPSRIDAAMVAGVIDRTLAALDEALTEEADRSWAGGFRYASFLPEVRPLALMLEDEPYRILAGEVSLGGGLRSGQVVLVLPATGRGEAQGTTSETEAGSVPQFTASLAAQVQQVDCRLDAVIGRLTMPLRQIMALSLGDVLELPSAATDAITLETADGRQLARARLGQNRGMRALKLADVTQNAEGGVAMAALHPTLTPTVPQATQELRPTG
jgi:flagellar motor switch protein FliM